jgi:5,10-methylenetetrahydrofolate reductase
MHLKEKLARGEFAVLAEITPPKGTDVTAMQATAARLGEQVDALVVPDLKGAVMQMSALGAAALLRQQPLDVVLGIQCRDRNRLALQADLLAAGALGVTDLLVGTSEDPRLGDHPQARSVDDLSPLDLLDAVRSLQQGRDLAGRELQGAPKFLVGATARTALDGEALAAEVDEVRRKAAAGAAYFVTPPLFALESIEPFLKAIKGDGIPVIPTVLLLKSAGMARYIDAHMDQISVPGALIDRIQGAEEASRECVRIAAEMVSRLRREGFSGALLSTVGWESRIPEILGAESAEGLRVAAGGAPAGGN